MKIFIQFIFWVQIVTLIIRLFDLSLSTWPKSKEVSLGLRVAETISGMGLLLWTAILLFT